MPFITEEIWQKASPLLGIKGETIMLQPYPKIDPTLKNAAIDSELEWVKQFIVAVRTLRSEMNVAPGKQLTVLLRKGTSVDKERYTVNANLIAKLAKLESCLWLGENESCPESAIALTGELEILVPMAGVINKAEESARLAKEIAKLEKEVTRAESKLQNPSFVDKAPADVVAKEREKLTEIKVTLQKLQEQREKIAVL
jgi:valyl-tRNA synthetase